MKDMATKAGVGIWLLAVLQFFAVSVFGQDVEVKTSVPKVVAVNEAFQLSYTLNKQPSSFQQPDLSAFLFSGPSTSRSFSSSYINGQVTQTNNFSYIYVIQIQKEGKFTIPEAKFVVDGKTYVAKAERIEVVKGRGSAAQNSDDDADAQPEQNATAGGGVGEKDLFVRMNVDKKTVYEGQPIVAIIKIYTRVSIGGFDNIKLPSFDGFWSQELETPQRINLQRENVDGIIYETGVMKKNLIFAQRSGDITIDPVELSVMVRYRSRPQSFWDDGFREMTKSIKSAPLRLKIKKLPQPQPATFTGAVGKFSIAATTDRTTVKANDAISLKVKITGNGNIKLISDPKIEFPSDFDKFDPKSTQDVKISEAGASGSKTFEYVLIPRYKGKFQIPAVVLTYFDPQTEQYQTVSTNPIDIDVAEGAAGGAAVSSSPEVNREDVANLNTDIRFIKTQNTELSAQGSMLYGSLLYWLYFVLLAVLFGVMVAVMQKQIRQNKNLSLMRTKRAGKVSIKRLKEAEKFMNAAETEKFFEEVLRTLWGYVSDKMGIETAKLTKDSIRDNLLQRGITEEQVLRFLALVDQCELARYAPSASIPMKDAFSESVQLIDHLEQKL
jgi:hypothetical protein